MVFVYWISSCVALTLKVMYGVVAVCRVVTDVVGDFQSILSLTYACYIVSPNGVC